MKCLIDADVLLHELGWSGQFKDKETGEDVLLSAEHVCDLLDAKIDVIKEECMSDLPPVLYITSSESIVKAWNRWAKWNDAEQLVHTPNFRYDIAKARPYKGTRKNPKPLHFMNLVVHMIDNYEVVISQGGLEADDEACIAQREALRNGVDTVICSRDKDLRICQGWHYSWECGKQAAVGPHHTDELGHIFKKKDGKVGGYGLAFFLAQLIIGDTADNIPGLPGSGDAAAFKLLGELTEKRDMIKAVKDLYKEKLGPEAKDYFVEQASLLWMIQKRDEPFDVRKLK